MFHGMSVMKLSKKSKWCENEISTFLENVKIPIRLSFMNENNEPLICSLWFKYENGVMWSASHKNSFLISQLKVNRNISFEVSTNDYPYKGVRGKATVELSKLDAAPVLNDLLSKYLEGSNVGLSSWLMSRVEDEYAIKIFPSFINSWDFSDRMDN